MTVVSEHDNPDQKHQRDGLEDQGNGCWAVAHATLLACGVPLLSL